MIHKKLTQMKNIISTLIICLTILSSCFKEENIADEIYLANRYDFLPIYQGVFKPDNRINIFHISDTHIWSEDSEVNLGDAIRLSLEPEMNLSAIVATGDLTLGLDSKTPKRTVLEQLTINSNVFGRSNVPTLIQLGNHDANDWDGVLSSATTKQEQWNNIFVQIANKWNKIVWGDRENGRHYCYYDIKHPKGNLRIIVLDQLDHDLPIDNSGKLVYRCLEDAVYSQKQINWLCNIALQVSSNTGVVICNHFPYMKRENASISLLIDGQFVQGWKLIPDIVEAWKRRLPIDKLYKDMRKMQDIHVEANFSNIDNQSEFICYLVGHIHFRTHGMVDGYEQLYIMEDTSGQGKGLFSKIERVKKTTTSNTFSALSIDRTEKNIYRTSFGAYIKNDQVKNSRLEIIHYVNQ